MFTHTLLHALTEIPKISGSATISEYLPKDISVDNDSTRSLMYPLAMGHILQPSEMKLSFSSLPVYGLFHTTKGNGNISSGSVSINVTGGSLVLVDLSFPFSIYSEKAFEYDVIYYSGAQSSYFFSLLSPGSSIFVIESLSKTGLQPTLRPVLPAERDNSFTSLAFHRHMTDLFTESCEIFLSEKNQKTNAKDETLSLIKEYLDNNYYKSTSLKDLEAMFFVNRFRLCKEFSEKYYISPIQYMHVTRINKAKELLKQSSLKVHEIGYQVGYESSTQFINHFKKATGRTPQEYRIR